jgi:hypothetical protein
MTFQDPCCLWCYSNLLNASNQSTRGYRLQIRHRRPNLVHVTGEALPAPCTPSQKKPLHPAIGGSLDASSSVRLALGIGAKRLPSTIGSSTPHESAVEFACGSRAEAISRFSEDHTFTQQSDFRVVPKVSPRDRLPETVV